MSGEWAQRWWELLHEAPGDIARRARRGAALVASSRVSDLRITPGSLSARVQGTRNTPYAVEITVPVLSDAEWVRIADHVSAQVRHSARLLAGQAPDGLAGELEAADVRLFPRIDELDVHCGCGEWLCRHAAALWAAAADQMADDPFTLLTLRGRGRQRLLDEVAARRATNEQAAPSGLELSELEASQWWDARAPLQSVPLPSAVTVRTPAPALKALGDPPGWAGGVGAYDLFAPLVARGAAWAEQQLSETTTTYVAQPPQ